MNIIIEEASVVEVPVHIILKVCITLPVVEVGTLGEPVDNLTTHITVKWVVD